MLYSHLPFLAVGNIHRVPFEDVNYLESRGCLHVPARPLLDNFVEQYFLHVHPLLPIVNEGDFWEMYSEVEAPYPPDSRMPLLLFQAMLFSSCAVSLSRLATDRGELIADDDASSLQYVPFKIIQQLGFSSLRIAQAEFYRRVKVGLLPPTPFESPIKIYS